MVFKKIIFQNRSVALETPLRRPPPPFMANTILNFHFDYWNPSLRRNSLEKRPCRLYNSLQKTCCLSRSRLLLLVCCPVDIPVKLQRIGGRVNISQATLMKQKLIEQQQDSNFHWLSQDKKSQAVNITRIAIAVHKLQPRKDKYICYYICLK